MGKKSRIKQLQKMGIVTEQVQRTHVPPKEPVDKRIYLFLLALPIIVLVAVVVGMSTNNESKASNSELIAQKSTFSFGDIDIFGGKVSVEYPLSNKGQEPVEIIAGKTSCACTVAYIDDKSFSMHYGLSGPVTIKPGETKIIKAVFDPLAHGPNAVGPILREITLQTNSTKTKEMKLKFDANVIKKQGS